MFELEWTLRPHRLADGLQHMRLVIGVNIFIQPVFPGLAGIGDKAAAIEVAHFTPVGAHVIHHIGTGIHECAEPLLASTQQLFRLFLIVDIEAAAHISLEGAVRRVARHAAVQNPAVLAGTVFQAVMQFK